MHSLTKPIIIVSINSKTTKKEQTANNFRARIFGRRWIIQIHKERHNTKPVKMTANASPKATLRTR